MGRGIEVSRELKMWVWNGREMSWQEEVISYHQEKSALRVHIKLTREKCKKKGGALGASGSWLQS
jgi:hypothetical protein